MKNCTPLWREAHSQVKMYILEVRISKNGAPLWREAHFQVKMPKTRKKIFLELGRETCCRTGDLLATCKELHVKSGQRHDIMTLDDCLRKLAEQSEFARNMSICFQYLHLAIQLHISIEPLPTPRSSMVHFYRILSDYLIHSQAPQVLQLRKHS